MDDEALKKTIGFQAKKAQKNLKLFLQISKIHKINYFYK